MPIVHFLASQPGRVVRALVGLAMIATGGVLGGRWRVLAVVGLVPLAAGVFDFCTLAPLLRRPFSGRRFREAITTG
jgi:hypothetical protein